MKNKRPSVFLMALVLCLSVNVLSAAKFILTSPCGKYLQHADGKPFLWLGDTAWELFHRLNREDANMYLEDRANKGFTIIQAVVLAEMSGLSEPNAYGYLPLIDRDPMRPNEAYFEHVDFIVNQAAKLGLVVGMLPSWGDKVTDANGGEPVIFNPDNAFLFGKFLGNRYKDSPIIWILGGDRNILNDYELEVWRAMANGLRKGDEGNHLISYHPRGASSSHEVLHNEPWLDFNIYQSGHSNRYMQVYHYAETLLGIEPRKPFIDGEPAYEEIALEFWNYVDWSSPLRVPQNVLNDDYIIVDKSHFKRGFFTAHDIRVHAYWNFLSGACGYTYGTNAIWQMFEKKGSFAIPALSDWRDALHLEGAFQMAHLRKVFEQYPFEKLVPAQHLVLGDNPHDSTHVRAAYACDNSFALVYLSVGQKVNVDVSNFGKQFSARWYDPRSGNYFPVKKLRNKGTAYFTAPSSGTNNDWLLIIEH
ncbi:glycoside hydrolase family 140 protein [Alkaliflexus imshenetskii]|uniref:glycoside hydrolase family 140 protein n=1 Tax=Alkaliflexus imshenetskii TaxID=286730 RepID=UPI000694F8A1|nr:glycoside hydrolase family 140 protein [Alkaliflexus imshenetskii]